MGYRNAKSYFPKTFKDRVFMAINLRDGTDTVVIVAGGLAGLYYGSENIPIEWTTKIVKIIYTTLNYIFGR